MEVLPLVFPRSPAPGGDDHNPTDNLYGNLVLKTLNGERVVTRGHPCRRVDSVPIRFYKTPLVAVRRTAWKNALREWEWFMSGSNNINDLHESVRHWWTPWADGIGRVPFNYSVQFREFHGGCSSCDQIETLIEGLRFHPTSRRLVATTWNAADMTEPNCPITNCHGTVIQFFSDEKRELSMTTYQRSCDLILGVPHNWVQYWAFLLWVAYRTGSTPKSMVWIGGDVHLYDEPSHLEAARWIVDHRGDATLAWYEGTRPFPELAYLPHSDDKDLPFRADDFHLSHTYVPGLYDKQVKMIV